jgi:hypothetical protein
MNVEDLVSRGIVELASPPAEQPRKVKPTKRMTKKALLEMLRMSR